MSSNQEAMPSLTWDLDDRADKISATRIRAALHSSDVPARYVPGPDAWAFSLESHYDSTHLIGPLYRIAGTAEVFSFVDDLTDYSTGRRYPGQEADPEDIADWVRRGCPTTL